jgi:hypothetical protein
MARHEAISARSCQAEFIEAIWFGSPSINLWSKKEKTLTTYYYYYNGFPKGVNN